MNIVKNMFSNIKTLLQHGYKKNHLSDIILFTDFSKF